MAVKILFSGTKTSGTINQKLECRINLRNEISVVISSINGDCKAIYLDKPTAIKLSKVLKSEISKIESEGSNG